MSDADSRSRAAAAYAAYGRDLHGAASLDEAREAYERVGASYPMVADVECRPAQAGGVPVEWISASGSDPSLVVAFFHGGGYSSGSIGTHRALMARLSCAGGTRVLGVDYRRSPEHAFPAAVEDAVTAYRYTVDDPRRFVVAGDSAGGGLALAALLALREEGDPLPAGYVGIAPWVDLTVSAESMTANADTDPVVTTAGLGRAAGNYLAGEDARNPLASPLYGDLTGLPPMLLQVGSREALLDDSRRLAERALAAGVDARLEVWEDMVHGWHQYAGFLPEGQEAIDRIGAFVREVTA